MTASLSLPPLGVYCGWVVVEPSQSQLSSKNIAKGRGEPYKTVVNIGLSPTFDENPAEPVVECYVIGWEEGDFYGDAMRLLLCGSIRPEIKFKSITDLKAQIGRDRDIADEWLNDFPAAAFRGDPFIRGGGVGRKGIKRLNNAADEEKGEIDDGYGYDSEEDWTIEDSKVGGFVTEFSERKKVLPLGKWLVDF